MRERPSFVAPFTFIYRILFICRGCPADSGIFEDDAGRRLGERHRLEDNDDRRRLGERHRLQEDGVCYCSFGTLDNQSAPTESNFTNAFNQTLQTLKSARSQFVSSVVDCEAGAACQFGLFEESTVRCFFGSSTVCESNVVFDRTTVQFMEAGSCESAIFYSSAAECALNACINAEFTACSCCDGAGCPFDGSVPSWGKEPESSLVAFCSSEYLDSKCQAWENPAFDTLEVLVDNPAVPAEFCNLNDGTNACRRGECLCASVTTCTILCFDACRNFVTGRSRFRLVVHVDLDCLKSQ
jgi:hypothetical protein